MSDSTGASVGATELVIRAAKDDDAAGLIELVGGCFAEYPGCLLDVDGEIPELRRIASYFAEHAGQVWVGERDGRVVGSIGFAPATDPRGIELKKLYVEKPERRAGLATRLADLVEGAAKSRARAFVDLWSDTRFEAAHAFYHRRGYAKTGATRELGDISHTVEYYFRLDLAD